MFSSTEELLHTERKNRHIDLKIWVTGGTKIRLEIPSNWGIFESNWLDIGSQFNSNILILPGIPGQIDSILRVNLTQIFSNYSDSLVEF